jgi:glucose/arabinose dehydrogenase
MSKLKLSGLCSLALLLIAASAIVRVSASRDATPDAPEIQSAPDGGITIQLQPVVSGLSSPVFVTNAHDGSNRLFIVEQGGIIKVLQPGATVPTEFLNITTRVLSGGERGLLGLAFHPQYTSNRRFFVYYTRQTDGAIRIAEYQTSAGNPNVADTTEKIIIEIPHPNNSNHNGGTLEFGPDGLLYFAPGDGGSANDPPNNSQNIESLLGKMIRINIDVTGAPYASPADNPYVGVAGRDEIYAIGLRNPYRFSFDRGGTRQLYVGDVGQGAWEEIDIITRGGNYGWRIMEGNHCNPNFNGGVCTPPAGHIPPIAEYSSASPSSRCSITGGYVYRGRRGTVPTGAYIFADYCTGEILMLNPATGSGSQTLLLDTSLFIVGFGEDEGGEIYVVGGSAINRIVNPNAPVPRNVVADFDGDLRTDISVFRPSSGAWYIRQSFTNSLSGILFGTNGDTVTPGDYDGDGKTDVAVCRNGVFYVLRSSNNSVLVQTWGNGTPSDDVRVIADYDGDRKTDFAVMRTAIGIPGNPVLWFILQSSNNTQVNYQWGVTGDLGVPGDYDGDGKVDVAIYRPSTNVFYVRRSRDGVLMARQWGTAGDTIVPGDYDGDGTTDFAVFRNSTGAWYIVNSFDGSIRSQQFGVSGDEAVPGDYDGDGKNDLAVTRVVSSNLEWHILTSGNNSLVSRQWGLSTDYEVPLYQTR